MTDLLLIGAATAAFMWLVIRWAERDDPNPKPGPVGLAIGLTAVYLPSALAVGALFTLLGWL